MNEILNSRPSPKEAHVLSVLMERGRVSYRQMFEEIYPDPDNSPLDELQNLKVFLCTLRKKLKAPARIKTLWGHGLVLLGVPGVPKVFDGYFARDPSTIQRKIAEYLADGRIHSAVAIGAMLYTHCEPESKSLVSVHIHNTRRRLADEYEIVTVRGEGYQLRKVR